MRFPIIPLVASRGKGDFVSSVIVLGPASVNVSEKPRNETPAVILTLPITNLSTTPLEPQGSQLFVPSLERCHGKSRGAARLLRIHPDWDPGEATIGHGPTVSIRCGRCNSRNVRRSTVRVADILPLLFDAIPYPLSQLSCAHLPQRILRALKLERSPRRR